MNIGTFALVSASAVLALLPHTARGQAPTVEKFYADNTLIIIMGGDPGGAHDLYARVLARHMGRHIPGKPNIVVQNKTGANGLVAANYVANTAPRDGSVIAGATPASLLEPLFQEGQGAHYDSRELGWIGNIASLQLVCSTWGASPVKTIADAKAHTVIVGAAAPTSSSSVLPNVMNNLLGTKFKIVTGYQNSALRLAVERAEVDGVCGWAFATLEASAPDWLKENKLNFLAQTGLKRMAQLPDVPLVSEIAETEEDKAVLRLLTYREVLGRPYFAPPGVPADRLAALRSAFAATMTDEAYLADAATSRQEINFTDYVGMQQVVADAYSVPKATLARVIALIKPPAAAK